MAFVPGRETRGSAEKSRCSRSDATGYAPVAEGRAIPLKRRPALRIAARGAGTGPSRVAISSPNGTTRDEGAGAPAAITAKMDFYCLIFETPTRIGQPP